MPADSFGQKTQTLLIVITQSYAVSLLVRLPINPLKILFTQMLWLLRCFIGIIVLGVTLEVAQPAFENVLREYWRTRLGIHLFLNSIISHLPDMESDHGPLILSSVGSYHNRRKTFKFEAFQTRDLSSHDIIVASTWLSELFGFPAFSLDKKWKNKDNCFQRAWIHQHFGRIQT